MTWLGWTAYVKLRDHSQETSLGQMTTLLEQISRSTMTHLDTARSNIALFSGSDMVKKYILTQDEGNRFSLMQPPLMRLFASYQRAYPDYYELRILLPDGYEDTRSTLTRLPNKTEMESDEEFFQQLQTIDDNVQTRYTRNPDNNQPVLYVGKKIVIRDESFEPIGTPPSLRGYLVISASLDFLQAQLGRHTIGQNGYLFITDSTGRPFITPLGKTINNFSQTAYTQLQQTMQHKQIVKLEYNNQQAYVLGTTLHPGLQLFAVLPETDVLADGLALRRLVATITIFTILFAAVLIFYAINRILIRPIHQLGKTALEIGSGRFDTDTGIRSRDELGELAHSFEEMGRNLQVSQEQINYLAYHDALTGLPNRRMFQEYLQRTLAHAQRQQEGLVLLFLDLDNFKKVNDSMGHQAGDQLLKDLSTRLTDCMRKEDQLLRQKPLIHGDAPHETLARVGGDEFLILLPHIKDPSDAAKVSQRILDKLAVPFNINKNDFFVSCSIGISMYPDDGNEVQSLIKNADIAMYHAKKLGRNNYQYFNESMNMAAVERMTMENELRKAISNKEFVLYYQPKIDIISGEIKGVEALIRWQHPVHGLVPPNKFIPVAEDSGLIVPMGEWIMDEATRQMSQWGQEGIDVTMSINISTVQLNKQNVVEVISKCIEQNNCPANNLEIELTETSIMDAHELAANMLEDIKALGVQISMDDFGVGYSSFSYLRNLPIDILKIDRSFVRDITTDQNDAAIISAIIAMAHTLNLTVVAEGVETLEQLHFLHDQNCDIAQGYLISRPLPALEFVQFLANRKRSGLFNTAVSLQESSPVQMS